RGRRAPPDRAHRSRAPARASARSAPSALPRWHPCASRRVTRHADPHPRRAGRLRGGCASARRSASREVHRRDLPRGRRAANLVHEAVHVAKHSDQKLHMGPIVSSDLFYNPNEGQYERWSARGVLAVEMEAAALFTVAAIRGVESACFLTVSDIVVEGVFTRITDDELKASVDRMTTLAL